MQYIEHAAYFYTPSKTGHGWQGNYEQIITVFENSCFANDIKPIRLEPLPYEQGHGLMFMRELVYRRFLKGTFINEVLLCDPDQVINRPIPSMLFYKGNQIACCAVPKRDKSGAMYNGVRIVSKCSLPIFDGTIKRMEMMSEQYQQWDGDSIAWQDAINEAILSGKQVRMLNPDLFISSPYRNAPKDAFMYHFKGNKGKDGMIAYGKQEGLL